VENHQQTDNYVRHNQGINNNVMSRVSERCSSADFLKHVVFRAIV
jgi:hypothetical protein